MKKLTATLCVTFAVLLGIAGCDERSGLQRVWMLPKVETTQLLCVNGNLLRNKGMLLPNTFWVLCTTKEKVFHKNIRLR